MRVHGDPAVYDPKDVRHIVLTHLDFDPAGGLGDFPHATVHMLADERDYAVQQRDLARPAALPSATMVNSAGLPRKADPTTI
jgi:glyoxylase-like metal-dependent hydrolase (beta-lactamase superfamily II)